MRKLLVLVVVLLVLGVAADLLAARAAEKAIATRVQQTGGLGLAPEVEVRGRPFLLQALRGRFDDVVVRASGVPAGQLRFESLVTQMQGLRVPLTGVLSGSVTAVPVDRISARGVVGYQALTALVADRGLRVADAGGGRVRVTGSVQVLDRTLTASAVSLPTLSDNTLVVTAERFEVGNAAADALLSRALGNRLDFRVELAALPYGLTLRSLQVGPGGVAVLARATDAVLAAS